MDEIRLIQAWVIASLGGMVGIGFLYVRRVEPGRAAQLWGAAWLAFFSSLIVSVFGTWPAMLVAHIAGTAFAGLLLAGALSFTGRGVPRFLIPTAFAIGALRGACRLLDFQLGADLGVYLFEAPAGIVAAGVLMRTAMSGRSTPAVAALGVLHAAFGALEIGNLYFVGGRPDTPFFYFALGSLATLALSLTQMLALLESARTRHTQNLELLRDLAQSGTVARDPAEVAAQALEAIRGRLDVDAGAIWLLRTESRELECMHYFGAESQPPDEVLVASADRPLPRQAMQTGAPLFLDDLQALPDLPVHPWYGEHGFRSGALLPVRKGDQASGILVLGRRRVEPFDPSEQRLLAIACDELYLALEHVVAVGRLAAERRVLASVIETSPTGILISDREGRVETLNATFTGHLGAREHHTWIGQPIVELVSGIAAHFDDPEEFARAFGPLGPSEGGLTTPVTLSDPDARELLVFTSPILSLRGDLLGRVWVTRDVSEERRLQEELRQSQKMETLGTLAGGVAHDFNNQLAAILGNARLLLGEERDPESRESLVDIERAAEHCADLTRSLLAFARRAPLARTMLQSEWVIEQAAALLRSMLPSTIRFEIHSEHGLPPVSADATQLQQMLINLVINARDAVGSDGTIRVVAQLREVASPSVENARPGQYVEFSVTDDGTGMEPETRRRVFDPFFTTKDVSQGTGLGLAVVYGAARAHDGWVEVESEPEQGSTFRVLIPAANEPPETTSTPAPLKREGSGSETILVADDEPKLRRLVARVLREQGYDVLEAADGIEAIRSVDRHEDAIALALLDVTMPELDGIAVLEYIRAAHPRLPVILMSGLMELDENVLADPATTFLAKPYDLEQVAATIRGMLDARR